MDKLRILPVMLYQETEGCIDDSHTLSSPQYPSWQGLRAHLWHGDLTEEVIFTAVHLVQGRFDRGWLRWGPEGSRLGHRFGGRWWWSSWTRLRLRGLYVFVLIGETTIIKILIASIIIITKCASETERRDKQPHLYLSLSFHLSFFVSLSLFLTLSLLLSHSRIV